MKLSQLVAEAQESLSNDGDRDVIIVGRGYSSSWYYELDAATKKGQTFQLFCGDFRITGSNPIGESHGA